MAHNDLSPEVISPVTFDGNSTRIWGGMIFVIHAAVGGNMSAASFGIDNGWGGTRVTSAFVNKFDDITAATYLWPWKGGVAGGVATDAKYNIMPIPSSDMGANPTLVQNDGY